MESKQAKTALWGVVTMTALLVCSFLFFDGEGAVIFIIVLGLCAWALQQENKKQENKKNKDLFN